MLPKKLRYALIIILSCLLIFVFLYWIFPGFFKTTTEKNNDQSTKADTKSGKTKISPILVEAAPAFRGDLIIRISASGFVHPIREVAISPKIGGEITQVPVKEGQFVNKENLLIQLDDREYQMELAEARNQLLTAQGEYEIKKLDRKTLEQLVDSSAFEKFSQTQAAWEKAQQQYKNGEIDEATYNSKRLAFHSAQILAGARHEEVVASKTGFSSAINTYEKAKINLSRLTIKAPFSGLIGDLNVQPGQYISAGTECCKLVDLSRIRVNVGVLESEIQHLKTGSKTTIQFPAYPDLIFKGKIVTINPIIDPENKTCRVTVELNNTNFKIKSGMFCYVKLDAQIFKDRLLVPRTAILTRDQRNLIFIVRKNESGENLAKWSYVDTGLENEEYIEILKSNLGLEEGEMVVTSGHYTLAHDAVVGGKW